MAIGVNLIKDNSETLTDLFFMIFLAPDSRGHSQIESLTVFDTKLLELVQIFLCFNTLSDHLGVQVRRDFEGAAEGALDMNVLCDPAYVFLIQLDHIRLEQDETFKTGVSEADVIDGDRNAIALEFLHRTDQVGGFPEDLLLADLQTVALSRAIRDKLLNERFHSQIDNGGRKKIDMPVYEGRERG